jgi:CDGSH-type Zn-finger protein
VDQEGGQFALPEGQFVTLCRCGWSDNKPFCDGTHRGNEPSFDAPTTAS